MDRLELGVERGIITAAQRDALRALGDEPRREARHGLNAVTIAYWVGGIAVLSAFGWFLTKRWVLLGPGGVLVVALVYAALFAGVARFLSREGFRYAAAVATLLVVGMTPIVSWAILSLAGWWNLYLANDRTYGIQPFNPIWSQLRWLPIDLATILVSLVALRRVAFGVLALPIALALAAFMSHIVPLVLDPEIARALGGRWPLLTVFILFAIAYAIDMRQSRDEDYALWFYAVGIVALGVTITWFWNESSTIAAHGMLVAAFAFAVAALRLRRRLLLFAAFAGFVSYIGYLAFDLFRERLDFPIALATMGLVVILSAVWLQRRFPSLIRGSDESIRRAVPGAPVALAGGILIALTMIVTDLPEARRRIELRYWLEHVERLRAHNRLKWQEWPRRGVPRPVKTPMS